MVTTETKSEGVGAWLLPGDLARVPSGAKISRLRKFLLADFCLGCLLFVQFRVVPFVDWISINRPTCTRNAAR